VPVPLGDVPAPEPVTPAGRIRRCVFRRIDRVDALPDHRQPAQYEVMCLYYGTMDEPMAMGDIDAARSVCGVCTASGIFRPDEV
jgi:hypothetical protein